LPTIITPKQLDIIQLNISSPKIPTTSPSIISPQQLSILQSSSQQLTSELSSSQSGVPSVLNYNSKVVLDLDSTTTNTIILQLAEIEKNIDLKIKEISDLPYANELINKLNTLNELVISRITNTSMIKTLNKRIVDATNSIKFRIDKINKSNTDIIELQIKEIEIEIESHINAVYDIPYANELIKRLNSLNELVISRVKDISVIKKLNKRIVDNTNTIKLKIDKINNDSNIDNSKPILDNMHEIFTKIFKYSRIILIYTLPTIICLILILYFSNSKSEYPTLFRNFFNPPKESNN
jgi:hypothetical protein